MIRHGFEEAGLDRIEASADTPNAAWLRVMEKAGMAYEKREIREGQDLTYFARSRAKTSWRRPALAPHPADLDRYAHEPREPLRQRS